MKQIINATETKSPVRRTRIFVPISVIRVRNCSVKVKVKGVTK